jgi:hypothetical protein
VTPILSMLLAIWIAFLFSLATRFSISLAGIHIVILGLGIASAGNIMRVSKYRRQYVPIVAYLNAHVQPADVVFGRSELYFGMRCKNCLRDDERLGANSGKRADFIVLDTDYRQAIAGFALTEKNTYRFIQELLSDRRYTPVFRTDLYEVLQSTKLNED